jgi:hypothetical protein
MAENDNNNNNPDGGGGTGENIFTWRDKLPEEFNTHTVLADYKDDADGLVGAVKSLIHSQKMIGSDKIPLPKEDATEEELREFWQKLGAPGEPDGYEFGKPGEAPEGFEIPDGLDEVVRAAAAKMHAPKGVAEGLWSAIVEDMAGRFAKGKEARELDYANRVKAFETQLGAAKDEKMKAIDQAAFALTRNNPDTLAWLQQTGLINEPHIKQIFLAAADGVKTDRTPPSGGSGPLTPAEAQAKIARIEETDGWMDNKRLIKERSELYKFAHPD